MRDDDRSPPNPEVESFFTAGGGGGNRYLQRLRLSDGSRLHKVRVAVVLTTLAWLPVLILAVVDGVAWGRSVEVPFVRDFLPYGQLLVAIPTLVLGEIAARRRLGLAAGELRHSGMVSADDRGALDDILRHAIGLGRGRTVDAVILALTLGATAASLFGAKVWLTGGWQVSGDDLTLPGFWYLFVSLPVMRFLALRWLWRALLWAWVLWRVARLELVPKPMHPDRAGGFAFLGETQVAFSVLVFVSGVQLSCLAADAVVFRGADLMAYRAQLFAFVVTSVVTLLLPLLAFAPKLVRAREEQLVVLSGHGHRGADHLERRLGSGDWGSEVAGDEISGMSDFGGLYENARLMRPLPMDPRSVVMLVLAAAIPFVPLVFLVMPAGDILRTLAKLLV